MSSIQERLYNYEQAPPANAWEKIAAALDESHLADQFPSTLYNAEATPPVATWDKIAAGLDTEKTPVIAMPRRSFAWVRYAAAAVVIGAIALFAVKWAGTNNNESLATTNNPVVNRKADTSIEKGAPTTNSNASLETEVASRPTNNLPAPEVETPKPQPTKKAKIYTVNNNDEPINAVYAYNDHTAGLADRYVMLMTPNGDIIRMSKKLGNLVCCVSGEDQDKGCTDQIKKWQEKLAASPVAPAPGNFMDILGLVSTLNDKEL
jgi:hypothetical protein